MSFKSVLAVVLLCTSVASAYWLKEEWGPNNFFDQFNFFNAADPTHGYVYYTTRDQAQSWNLISTSGDTIYIRPDTTSRSSGSGRAAVRIESWEKFNEGLFTIDLAHMPTGCGTWPAFWMVGPSWPAGGEIDIIEGVNDGNQDQVTLHTSGGCDQNQEDRSKFSGNMVSTNCVSSGASNNGCGIVMTQPWGTYGSALNQQGGGIFATVWNKTVIATWFFKHGEEPSDLAQNIPKPEKWGKPQARFDLGWNCDPSHFKDLQIVINLTFCGDWCGAVFSQQCPNKGRCEDFVRDNPGAFTEAYWAIHNVKIFNA